MLLNIITFLFLLLFIIINSVVFKNIICPINIFIIIWGFVLINSIFVFTNNIDIRQLLYAFMFLISFIIPSIIIYPSSSIINKSNYTIDNLLISKKKKIEIFIYICLIFRFIQIVYYFLVVRSLGGSIKMLFGDAQWLRFAYLDYSANITSLFQKIIVNFINYIAEMGIVLSALYSFKFKKFKFLILTMFFALLSSIFSMSKMAFIIDAIFVLAVLSLYTYKSKIIPLIERQKLTKLLIKTGIFVITLAFVLFVIIAKQRGYQNKQYSIEGIDNIVIFEIIAYLVTPYMAFNNILNWDIDYSYGVRTFYPFLKRFYIPLQDFGSINVGIEETTVYTMPGIFYVDFGFIGSLVCVFLFSILLNFSYKVMIEKRTFSSCITYCSFFVCLVLSFFTWMGRITFFWFFPVFSSIIFNFFISKKIKL